jgi:hypothetical protein
MLGGYAPQIREFGRESRMRKARPVHSRKTAYGAAQDVSEHGTRSITKSLLSR